MSNLPQHINTRYLKSINPAIVSAQYRKKQDVNHDVRSLDAEQHIYHGPTLPEPDCDVIQTASMNAPHIFVRACVAEKPELPTNGMDETENVADSAKGSQSTNTTQTFQYDLKKLQKMFADTDKRLRSKKYSEFSREYRKCPSHTLQEAETRSLQILQQGEKSPEEAGSGSKPGENIKSTVPNDDKWDLRTPDFHPAIFHFDPRIKSIDTLIGHSRRQKKFLKIAKTLFTFFLPLGFTSALVAKYWGAVHVLIEVRATSPVTWVLTPFKTCVAQDHHKLFYIYRDTVLEGHLLDSLRILTSDWTQGKAPPPWRMKIPDVLGDAWLHLIMFFVLSLDDDLYLARTELSYSATAVSRGREEILRSLAPQSLREMEAVTPLGIASLVFENLINQGVPGQPDVAFTYFKYLEKLVRQML